MPAKKTSKKSAARHPGAGKRGPLKGTKYKNRTARLNVLIEPQARKAAEDYAERKGIKLVDAVETALLRLKENNKRGE